MSVCSDWRELPFDEIWAVDTEFHPGPGLARGGRSGDAITPLALVALEMRTGRLVRLWQDEIGPFPPYRLDEKALFFTYFATAEMGFHLAAGWGRPARLIDAYAEFRHHTNDARVKTGDREKGFYSIGGALRFFGEDMIDVTRKSDMRERILQGPPFSLQEREDILAYCEDDAHALVRLVKRLVPTIPSLRHALYRGQYECTLAQQERRGVPLDLPILERIRTHWDAIQVRLVETVDKDYGVYEIEDGRPHFRDALFEAYLRRQRIAWPRYADGTLDKRAGTFRDMGSACPQIEGLRELRSSLSELRLNRLAVGRDGRNRALLGPFGTKTGRNAPSNSEFVFGPAKWIRFLIAPPPGLALIHRDFSQQEVRIAAAVSGDHALMAACESGDVYIGIAKRLGLVPDDATPDSHPDERKTFKAVVLGIIYGLGTASLAMRTGISLFEAREILARLRAEFRVFEDWAAGIIDRAGLTMRLSTPFGWTVRCPPGSSPRTIRNWPIQATGAEILRAACILAERRGIRIVAPIHDAFLAEGPAEDIEDVSAALNGVMRDASALVLQGYELPTSADDPIMPGGRYFDERGEKMWTTVTRLVGELERKTA
jgi:DNA polymerase I